MASLIRVPEVAAGSTEVIVDQWLVDEGVEVAVGQPIAVVETEKAVVEIEADIPGTVLRRLAPAGESAAVGSPLAMVGDASEQDLDPATLLGTDETTTTPDAPVPSEALTADAPAVQQREIVEPAPPPPDDASRRIFAAPLPRRLLAEAGVPLELVTGSGPNGRITKKDALAAIDTARAASAAPVPAAPVVAESPVEPDSGAFTDEPHSRIRRAIAARLTESKQTVPHFYLRRTVRLDALTDLRKKLNDVAPQRISVNDLLVRAVGLSHRRHPECNVIWTAEALRHLRTIDVGVAVASARGLVTPVLRNVDECSPSTVGTRIKDFIAQANDGRLHQRDLEGGSIAVSNLGMYGVDDFAAIINPPQSMILAVGAARETPVVEDGNVVIGTSLTLTLAVDHRAIDGALAAQWFATLVDLVEQPMQVLV